MKPDLRNVLLTVSAVGVTLTTGTYVYRASEVGKEDMVQVDETSQREGEIELIPLSDTPQVLDASTTVVESKNIPTVPATTQPITDVPVKTTTVTPPTTPVVVPPPVVTAPVATTVVEEPIAKPSRTSSAS